MLKALWTKRFFFQTLLDSLFDESWCQLGLPDVPAADALADAEHFTRPVTA